MLSRAQQGCLLCSTWQHSTRLSWICFQDGASQSWQVDAGYWVLSMWASPQGGLRFPHKMVLGSSTKCPRRQEIKCISFSKPEPRNWTVMPLHSVVQAVQTQIQGGGHIDPPPCGRSVEAFWKYDSKLPQLHICYSVLSLILSFKITLALPSFLCSPPSLGTGEFP